MYRPLEHCESESICKYVSHGNWFRNVFKIWALTCIDTLWTDVKEWLDKWQSIYRVIWYIFIYIYIYINKLSRVTEERQWDRLIGLMLWCDITWDSLQKHQPLDVRNISYHKSEITLNLAIMRSLILIRYLSRNEKFPVEELLHYYWRDNC